MKLEQPLSQQTPSPVDTAGEVGQLPPTPQTRTLTDYIQELRFFTPALLVTHSRFPRDPAAEFNLQFPDVPDRQAFSIDCQEGPFFQGLGTRAQVNWDRRVYAICQERWEECREFLARITVVEKETQFYAETLWYETTMTDIPLMHRRPGLGVLPRVPLTVFVSNSTVGFALLAADPLGVRPALCVCKPQARVVQVAKAIWDKPPSK